MWPWVCNLIPAICQLCHTECAQDVGLCDGCLREIPFNGLSVCCKCAVPLPKPGTCGDCLVNHPPPWHRVYAMARYEYPIPFLIHRFKFQNDQIAGHLLARLFVRHLRNISTPDILLPVPLGRNRLRSRGFNQTVELSRYISRHTPVPTLSNAVDRLQTIDRMQSTLHSKRERKNNVKGVFHVKPSYF